MFHLSNPADTNTLAVGALGALNAVVGVALAGQVGAGFQLAAGTLIGTLVGELSFDNGTTWNSTTFLDGNTLTSSLVFSVANTAQARTIVLQSGATHARVRISAFTSGTATLTMNATRDIGATVIGASSQTIGTLNALNAAVTVNTAGQRSAGLQLAAGTLIGTLVPEVSFDGGTAFGAAFFDDVNSSLSSSMVFTAPNTAQARTISVQGGMTHARVRVSAFTSGTATLTLNATNMIDNTVVTTPSDGFKRTYGAAVVDLVAAATPTDIFTITGAVNTLVRVLRIILAGTRTANGISDVLIIKRSTANSAGTSTTPTAIPYDSLNSAAVAVVRAYTVNPTLGTTVGTLFASKIFMQVATNSTPSESINIEFGKKCGTAVILRSAAEVLAVNLNAVTIAGSNYDMWIEWTEETV